MSREHVYDAAVVRWTGDRGGGTSSYTGYDRAHTVVAPGKPVIRASSDPAFRGDPEAWNPEELLVASLSACHLLWYLHLCAVNQIVVTGYEDQPRGVMLEDDGGGGRFIRVTLRPAVTVATAGMLEAARDLHAEAHERCFIANSVTFPVEHEAIVCVALSRQRDERTPG
jgi:organic hydroperoxide reductase OsmC/OhrA